MKKEFPIAKILKLVEKENNCVFLESAKADTDNYLSYIFLRPHKVISTTKIDKINSCLIELDEAIACGFYVAGFMSYEAGEAFEDKLRQRRVFDFPLLWFGVYDEPLIYNHQQEKFKNISHKAHILIKKIDSQRKNESQKYLLGNIRPNISKASYIKAIAKIKKLITQGFTYQVNHTFKLKFPFSGSAANFYLKLRDKQNVSYSSFLKTDCYDILSFSPELFFRKDINRICTRPMKGTARRGRNLEEDSEISRELKACLKNRSENLMIVDLLRNDLGRISLTGSVRVPRLFTIEKYQTLFQMTSDIKSRLKLSYSSFDIFRHIFPSGSVTGAPKIQTMQIIRNLEKEPRNIYTGSIGFFAPDKSGVFNVAIRTLLMDRLKKTGEMGVGSGIVYDSNPVSEFAECRLKSDFLTKAAQDFELIETMLWQPNRGLSSLDLHLKRLQNSAKYFDFTYQKQTVLAALARAQKRLKNKPYRMRLLLNKKGDIKIEASLLRMSAPGTSRVCFSTKCTNSASPFLYHKTTNRKIYNQEYKKCKSLGFYDIIFTNEKGEITEGAISNIFIRKNGIFYTPPVSCGLLDGVYRQYMLLSGKYRVKEKVLFKRDLLRAKEVYLSNSVRGLVKVCLG